MHQKKMHSVSIDSERRERLSLPQLLPCPQPMILLSLPLERWAQQWRRHARPAEVALALAVVVAVVVVVVAFGAVSDRDTA